MNTQNTLPTSFRIIGLGVDAIPMIGSIQKPDYDGLSAQMSHNSNDDIPDDQNAMLIILMTGEEKNAAACARTFFQAGVLTIAVCTNRQSLIVDCCDTQLLSGFCEEVALDWYSRH